MFPRQQDVKSPASRHSEMHTPRSIHSRTSNQRQELSPYVGGRKNYEYVNPLYGGNKVSQDRPYDNYNQPQPQPRGINISQEKPSYNYNQAIQRQQSPYHQKDASPYNQQTQPPYFQQETPKTPQRGPKSVISNSSSNSEAIDMVCTNCINKHLMMEKKERDRMEKEKDQLLRQINESNYQNAAQKENEKQRYLKEQYKNDSNIQLEQINNKKVRDENLKKSSKDQNNQSLINPDKERMQRLSEMQNDLKKDLLRQINAKENEKKNEKLNNDNYKMTLDIGNDFRPRSALPQNYRDDLREQILLKENQKQMEKEVKINIFIIFNNFFKKKF